MHRAGRYTACHLHSILCSHRHTWRSGQRGLWLWSRGFVASHARRKDSNDDGSKFKSGVTEWVQDFPWSKLKQTSSDDSPFLDGKTASAAKRMNKEISQLNRELREMETRMRDGSFLEPALKMLPPDEQEAARLRIAEAVDGEARAKKEIASYFSKVKVNMDVAPEHKLHLQNLNLNLENILMKSDERDARKGIWQSYLRCKAFLPAFLQHIPDEAWNVLSRTLIVAQLQEDSHWSSHRITLYEDMRVVGKAVDSSQRLLYVEALRNQGQHKDAIGQWQDMRDLVKASGLASAQYELIGVNLFTSQGNPGKAERIAFEYLDKEPPEEARILVPILASWLERGDEVGMKHAWALYLRLKSQLGTDITMQDYDNVTMTFLRGGRTDLALAVFKDMMLTGRKTGEESLELYKKAVGLMAETQNRSIKVEDINGIALTSLTVLPRRYQNRFFYGSWLKKLIGMGETGAAAQVVELMYERGVKPDSKHLNGIIGAWMRSDAESNYTKAEQMAWAMVHERLDFVRRRGGREDTKTSQSLPRWVRVPTHLKRKTAPANIETFCLLLQHYVTRRRDDDVQTVQRALAAAEIPEDHYFMNHLLFHEVLHGNLTAVWAKYVETFQHISPDMETFVCLWDSEKKHLERVILNLPDEYPGPRVIMREMMNWFFAQDLKHQRRAQEYFDKALYDRILRCMCLAKDFQGVIVASYALRDAFGVYPDADVVKAITLDVARMGIGVGNVSQGVWRPRRARAKNVQVKANASKVDQLFAIIWHERAQTIAAHGLKNASLTDEMQQEEGLWVLAEFLRTILKRTAADGDGSPVESKLADTAVSMGVGGIDMDDPLPSYRENRRIRRIDAPSI